MDNDTTVEEDIYNRALWLDVIGHPHFEKTYQARVMERLIESNERVLDEKIDEKQRLIFIGMVKAFSEVRGWADMEREAHAALKEEQAMEARVEEDVEPDLENQWHQNR